MMKVRHPAASLALAALSSFVPLNAAGQSASEQAEYAAPAHVAVVDGVAVLERQGVAEPAAVNVPLVAGDRLRTERGRLEVLFPDGSALDLDQFTTIAVPSDTMLAVLEGRVRLTIDSSDPEEAVTYRIDTPGGTVEIRTVGEYRVALTSGAGTPQVELAVVRGLADLTTGLGSVSVRAGERAVARIDAPPSMPYLYNAASWDAFDRWSEDRRNARLGVASAAYLPSDLVQYGGAFDRYGTWEQNPAYGYVWYPAVAVGWRPYYHGHWSFFASFGWTWVGYDPWSWPTHHYGRWGASAGRWYWIPGRHWGPAWVSWAYSPNYVAWCPLGYDGYPVVSFSMFWTAGGYPHRGYHPWTVLPTPHFGRPGHAVSTYAVAAGSLDRTARERFAQGRPAGLAVPRSRPIVSAGTREARAVPRPGSLGRAVPRPGTAGGAAPARGLAERARPSATPATPQRAVPRATASARPTLGSLGSQTRSRTLGEGAPARRIRIVGQPRPAAPAGAPDVSRADATAAAPGPSPDRAMRRKIEGPARVRPPSAMSPDAGASRAVPRAGFAAPSAGPRAATAPDRRQVRDPRRGPDSGGAETPAGLRDAPRAPSRAIGQPPGAGAPPTRSRSMGDVGALPPPPARGGIRAPSGPSGAGGEARAPSRPTGGVRPPMAPSRSPGAGAPSGGRAPAASRAPSGDRAAPRGAAPGARPRGGGRPRGGA